MAETLSLQERLAEILCQIADEPLIEQPGTGPESPAALYLRDFRPDLSEEACKLLEECGL